MRGELRVKRKMCIRDSNMGDKNSRMVQARDHLLKMSLSDDPFLQSSLYATSPQAVSYTHLDVYKRQKY